MKWLLRVFGSDFFKTIVAVAMAEAKAGAREEIGERFSDPAEQAAAEAVLEILERRILTAVEKRLQ